MKPLSPLTASVLSGDCGPFRGATPEARELARLVDEGWMIMIPVDHTTSYVSATPAGERVLRIHRAWIAAGGG